MISSVGRVQYSYNKLSHIRRGVYPEYGGDVENELYTFFEVAYHLKDHIKKSDEYENLSDVEGFINESPPLRICADICNTLKHKGKNQKPRSKTPIGIFKLTSLMEIHQDPSKARAALLEARIHTELGETCCYELARQIMLEWNRYFERNSLKATLTI